VPGLGLQVVFEIAFVAVVVEPVAIFVWMWRRLRRGLHSPGAAIGWYALWTALGPVVFLAGLLWLQLILDALGFPSGGDQGAGLFLWFLLLLAYVACADFVFAAAVAIR
jgi:hypothetical protein